MKLNSLFAGAFALALALVLATFGADPALASAGGIASAGMGAFGMIAAAGGGRIGMTAAERLKGRFMRGPDHSSIDKMSPEQAAETLRKQIDEKHGEVLKKSEEALDEAKKAGELSTETKNSVDQALLGINTLREQLTQVEQKMATKPGSGGEIKGYGAQLVESEKFDQFKANGFQGSARFQLKAITSTDANVVSDRDLDVPVGLPKRSLTIRDLLTVVPTDSGSIDYAKQTVRTNNAAPVAEGAQKPTSVYGWSIQNVPVRTIAHLAKITRQAMDDAKQLKGEVTQEMQYGLKFAEEEQLLKGDGTGQNLDGLMPNATAFAAPFTLADPTRVDILRLAMVQAEVALFPADGHVLNPIDWGSIELTKTTEGAYVFAQPQGLAGPRMWGLPVVSTVAQTPGNFLTGGFKLQTLYDRMSPEVLIASENSDDFEKNLYTMRCEERLALAIKRAAALITGEFAAAITAATAP